MIQKGKTQALVRALAGFQDRENLVEIEINTDGPNRAKVNRSDLARPKEILGYIRTVFFTPEDRELVAGDPSDRRNFLDDLMLQFSPRLLATQSEYDRALKQRNSLLKTSRNLPKDSPGLSTLYAWDESLIKLGSEIIAQRFELVEKIKPLVREIYKQISEDDRPADIAVVTSVLSSGLDVDEDQAVLTTTDREWIADKFRARLEELRPRELERGITLVGPHRDDLKLMLGEFPAKGYISYGEGWSYAIALKLASAQLLRTESQSGDPVLILDDVFSSLDDKRLQGLMNLIADYEQVIITDAIRGNQSLFDQCSIFEIKGGEVTQVQ
jgi:DNA replication and repair protein RecF